MQTSTERHINLPWTESPFFEKELTEARLNPHLKELVKQYAEQGFVIFDPEIDKSILDEAVSNLLPRFEADEINRIQDAWKYSPASQKIAAAPKIMELLRVLYRREPIPFQTLNFNVGTQQKTHSDSIHFNSVPQRFMCGVWVALEDVRDDNGPLHYYPESHKLPCYDLVDIGLMGSAAKSVQDTYGRIYANYENFIEEMTKARHLKKAILNINKGQAIVWAANLLHGGEKITRPGATRHSQVTHYFFENCVYYTPLLSDSAIDRMYIRQITNIATGEAVQNKYFQQSLKQNDEGYPKRLNIPASLLKFKRFIPGSIKKLLRT